MPQYCYLGIDDGYFDIRAKKLRKPYTTILVAALTCPHKLFSVHLRPIHIDALDAQSRALELVEECLAQKAIRALFLDGVTYAGFNIIDPIRMHRLINIPIIVVFRYPLDLAKVFRALRRNFSDWVFRYRVIEETFRKAMRVLPDHNIFITPVGISPSQAIEMYNDARTYHPLPEALRLADCVASGLTRYLSAILAHA